jgi:hypothetical protein
VPDIKKVFIRETEQFVPDDASGQGYKKQTEWMLDTEGVNLAEVCSKALSLTLEP